MRVSIGIVLIVTGSVLFTVMLPENTMAILATPPLFVVGVGLICSKIQEMGDDILSLRVELNKFIKENKK